MIVISVSTTKAQEIPTLNSEPVVSECEKQIQGCHDQIAYFEEQVVACEQVVTAGNKYIKALNTQLDQKTELAASLERELALTRERAANLTPQWYERPGFVVPATIVATVLTVIAVRKAVQD
jgi:chromosome segregation ATPase